MIATLSMLVGCPEAVLVVRTRTRYRSRIEAPDVIQFHFQCASLTYNAEPVLRYNMQQTVTPPTEIPELGRGDRDHRCHECGNPIIGIESAGPGTHRFVGCGHRASGRFVRAPADAGSNLLGIQTG